MRSKFWIKHAGPASYFLSSVKSNTMIRKLPLLALAVALISCQAEKMENETVVASDVVNPESVGLVADSLDRIREHIQWAIDSQYIAGGVALVARHGKIAWFEAIGFSDSELTDTLRKDDIFRIASMTKPVTTTAVMQLYEQGKLDTKDPVSKYIPEFANSAVLESVNETDSTFTTRSASRAVTIHDLLTHTSGLTYSAPGTGVGKAFARLGVTEAWTKDDVVLAENAKIFAKLPLMHDPGTQFTYGTSIDVLGRVVEVVSGQPLDEYIKEHILSPLGMEDTYFYLPPEKHDRLVDVWYTPGTNRELYNNDDYPVSGAGTYFAGGAGLSSTAMDYFKFADALRMGGGNEQARILKEETVALMTSNQIDTLHLGEGEQFGYGFSVFTGDGPFGRKKGRYSWGGFWQTIFWVDPSRDIVAILFTNARETPKWNALFDGFERIVNQSVATSMDHARAE